MRGPDGLIVICFQLPVDKISRSHSAENTAATQTRNTEGMFCVAQVSLTEKMNKNE